MWGNKKPDTPPLGDPGPKIVQANQSLKPAPASWGRTTKMNKDVMRPTGAAADRATARLGSSLHVKGEISGNEDLHIDGTVEGAVQLGEGKLTVGATANVTSDIIAREVVVRGNVKGNLRAKGKIEIKKDGSVIGELTTAQIIMEDGTRTSKARSRWTGARTTRPTTTFPRGRRLDRLRRRRRAGGRRVSN